MNKTGLWEIDMPWGPCGKIVEHYFECPPEKSMPMCQGHWDEANWLLAKLEGDDDLAKEFEKTLSEVEADGIGFN